MTSARRIVYLVMILAVAVPVLLRAALPPSRMVAAETTYKVIEELPIGTGDVAMIWFDFGPNTIAENEPQAEVIIEHLFRRRIPIVLISQYQQAEAFLNRIPRDIAKRLSKEKSGETWSYGKDWINVGFQPGQAIFMQALAKSENITNFLGKDVQGTPISQFPPFSQMKGLESIKVVGQITGLVGTFDNIIQYFQKDGYRPKVIHGCTSITIPEAYIFLDSGQLNGLLEGIAGAAWYSQVLSKANPGRANDVALVRNTALGVAHVVLILLIVAGNVAGFMQRGGRRG